MLTIYEVREKGGEYEDAYDFHVKAFMFKKDAEAFMEQANADLARDREIAHRCECCPLNFACCDTLEEMETRRKANLDYAPCVANAPVVGSNNIGYWVSCGESEDLADTYYIKEIEVY